MKSLLVLIALLVGCLMPFQAAINGQLTTYLKHPIQGAFISFMTGTFFLSLVCLVIGFPEAKKLLSIPPHLFLGGLLGTIFVLTAIVLIPKIGATSMIAAFVTGQLMMSLVIDHYGLLVVQEHPLSMLRLLGSGLLLLGLYLIVKY